MLTDVLGELAWSSICWHAGVSSPEADQRPKFAAHQSDSRCSRAANGGKGKMVSQDIIQPWTAEQIVDMPVPKVVEEHVEITKVSSRNRAEQRFEEQSVGWEHLGVQRRTGCPCASRASGGGVPVSRRHGSVSHTDRDSPSMSWKGCCCSFERTQLLRSC